METVKRFFNAPSVSFFLFGPRGTGKTTWLNQHFEAALRLDLLKPATLRTYQTHPEFLSEVVLARPKDSVVIIDEVQKVPQLLDVVHDLVEQKTGHTFILTGSSSRKIKKEGADLLAGRVVLRNLHPFMAAELGSKFSLSLALEHGMLPVVFNAKNPEDVLKTYIALYVKEEVQQEGLVRNIGAFNRFLETISFSHAAILNVSNVARDCEIDRKIIEGYLGILEDLLLSFKLPVFSKRAKRKLSVHSKFYLFDAGVFRGLRPKGPLDRPQEIDGACLEGLVAQHLRAWVEYSQNDSKIYFWRTQSGNEVDFVVYGSEVFLAIEVKNTGRLKPEDFKSLKSFRDEYPESKQCLVYRGNDRFVRDGILCVPAEEFLRNIVAGQKIF